MSGFMVPELWCDGGDVTPRGILCSEKLKAEGEETLRELRQTARGEDWTRTWVDGQLVDLCDDCSEVWRIEQAEAAS